MVIMDQPDSSGDGLQPQDLSSSCALPIAFDLSKKGEDCLRKASAVEALHVVQPQGWYVGAGTSEAVTFPENTCDLSPVPGEQIQPDNAFSNTTVTLSYVSRSHVFSSTPLTAHCPLYDVSSLSKKLSQHASGYEALPLMSEADGAPLCVEMDPHCLQPVATPVGVAPHESFEFVLPAQVMQNVATGVCFLKHAVDLNGIQDSGDAAAAVEILTPLQQGAPIVCKLSQEENGCLQNGDCALWDAGACGGESASGDLFTTPAEVQGKRDSEVLFLISRTEQPLGVHDMGTTRHFCSSLNREYISPLEDPVSPPATPQDEIEDVFVLPQTASSPTGENFPEDLVTKHSEVGLSSPLPAELTCTGETECLLGNSNTENISELSCQPLTDNGLDTEQALSEQCHDLPEDKASGMMDKAESTAKQQLNDNTPAKKGQPERKILPPRSGRGIRLEAIVQNINPSRFRVSRTRSTKKSNCLKVALAESKAVSINREIVTASDDPEMRENVCTSEQETSTSETSSCLLQTSVQREEGGDSSSCFKEGSTSDSEHTQSLSKYRIKGTSDEMTNNTSSTPTKKSGKRPSGTSNCKSSNNRRAMSPLPPPRSHKKKSQPAASPQSKSSPTAKKAHTPKKKRKKVHVGHSSMFSPKEPEIKLKYVNYKEEKRDSRADTFSPFVHVERKRYVSCTVVNYPEEVKPTVRKGLQQPTSGFVSGVVPSTPFLQYGRVSNDATRRAALVCCLCGRAANTLDLGDLHGPYYANGSKAETRPTAGVAGLKAEEEEDLSDSDSSFGTKARKCASAVPGSWARRARQRRPLDAALGGPYQRWTSDGELSHSPAAKKSRLDGGAAESWYIPPVVPLDSNEYWLHEDCGIWSAGVFLVKGRLYGLEKAVKMAQETMCSMCHSVGATLGCFFRECPNKYHYICAVQSDCVLNEENFSMKCTKHKNKSIKGSTNRKNAR
ncbi:transcription factor 20 isoform X1 [Alosa sapidissima]|uniref:transcription factor 20 isoform X1 n=2 Tax=Alosa sapidissima TaxID=34773 RepID=UPI001C09BD81|nr:transcription factor 20 isoform X1 [Alosa sapidissima]